MIINGVMGLLSLVGKNKLNYSTYCISTKHTNELNCDPDLEATYNKKPTAGT